MVKNVIRQVITSISGLREKFSSRGLILMYHSIAEIEHDPFQLAVTPEHFTDHMAVLKERFHPMSLSQLVKALANDSVPDRAVAITFDDGYANNYTLAKPILEQFCIPATVFVTSENDIENREFWWDALDSLFLRCADLPRYLSIQIDGELFVRELANFSRSDIDTHIPSPSHPDGVISRRNAFDQLWALLFDLDHHNQQLILDNLFLWAGITPTIRESHRPLSTEEIRNLAQSGLVDIGGHTSTHSNLPRLTTRNQISEIGQNKTYLEETLGRPVTSFSYPYGRYSDETKILVKNAGFDFACAADGSMTLRKDFFRLPRVGIGNLDGVRFENMIDHLYRYASYPRPFENFVINVGRHVLPKPLRHWLWNVRQRLIGFEEAP